MKWLFLCLVAVTLFTIALCPATATAGNCGFGGQAFGVQSFGGQQVFFQQSFPQFAGPQFVVQQTPFFVQQSPFVAVNVGGGFNQQVIQQTNVRRGVFGRVRQFNQTTVINR